MNTPKAETYCASCHWQYCRHYGPNKECPTPDGLQAIELLHCFTTVPIHGAPEAAEAMDATEEPFDAYRAWRIQKVGILCIIMLGIVCSMLIGLYIGHFVWL